MIQENLYQHYKSQSLETLTPEELVIKLFEEASKQINAAIYQEEKENFSEAFNCIAKAQKIISTLLFSLDHKYAIAAELSDHYQFIFEQLGKANATQDMALVKEMLSLVDELKRTFKEAKKLARAQHHGS